MAKSYQQLQAEIELLQKKAEMLRKKELAAVIKELKQAIAHWGLTAEDLGLQGAGAVRVARKAVGKKAASKAARKASGKTAAAKKSAANGRGRKTANAAAAPKYRDDQGNAWGGRGPRPGWVKAALEAGRSIEEFAV